MAKISIIQENLTSTNPITKKYLDSVPIKFVEHARVSVKSQRSLKIRDTTPDSTPVETMMSRLKKKKDTP